MNELLCSVKPLNRSRKVISDLSVHVSIDPDHLPEGKRSNLLNCRDAALCDILLLLLPGDEYLAHNCASPHAKALESYN